MLIMLEFGFPAVSDTRLGSSELILFLLTLMAHPGVFDHAVGLVEEVRRTPIVGQNPRPETVEHQMVLVLQYFVACTVRHSTGFD